MTTIEDRIQRLEDLAAIHQLFIDYGRYLDAGNFEGYADLFHEDGEVRLGPMGTAKGRDNIKSLMTNIMTGRVGTTFHVISSPMVTLDGDTATSDVMWTVIESTGTGGPQLAMVGRHVDDLRRRDGRWRFQRRTGYLSLPLAAERLGSPRPRAGA